MKRVHCWMLLGLVLALGAVGCRGEYRKSKASSNEIETAEKVIRAYLDQMGEMESEELGPLPRLLVKKDADVEVVEVVRSGRERLKALVRATDGSQEVRCFFILTKADEGYEVFTVITA